MRRRREDYFPPVGFGSERPRWVGRLLTAAFVGFIVWLFVTKVISPPQG